MDNETQLYNYMLYLRFLNSKLSGFFDKQKPFIFCKEGCAKCCKNAEFPYSYIEHQYLMAGYAFLDEDTQEMIFNKINKILSDKRNYKGEGFKYDCPFLINDRCSVYNYRGIVCRSFGLLYTKNDRVKVPFCCFEGLNYSNVMNPETKKISEDKVKSLKTDLFPYAYNVSYDFLTNKDFEKGFELPFEK